MKTPWQIQSILHTANELQRTGTTSGSTGERIAAAFVLNRPEYLPPEYSDIIEAWDRLGFQWQGYVQTIKQHYMHLLE